MHYKECMRTTSEASPDDLLTTQEVAAKARVSPATVTRWAKDGTLTSIRLGGRLLRFRRSDVDAFLSPDEPTEATA